MRTSTIQYSADIEGDRGNCDLKVRFDLSEGYLGISQSEDRVLLSPKQVEGLVAFVGSKGIASVTLPPELEVAISNLIYEGGCDENHALKFRDILITLITALYGRPLPDDRCPDCVGGFVTRQAANGTVEQEGCATCGGSGKSRRRQRSAPSAVTGER